MDNTQTREIYLVNNDAGTADPYSIPAGPITVGELFTQQMPGKSMSDYTMRVNRAPSDTSYQLNAGDQVAFTPSKVQGA